MFRPWRRFEPTFGARSALKGKYLPRVLRNRSHLAAGGGIFPTSQGSRHSYLRKHLCFLHARLAVRTRRCANSISTMNQPAMIITSAHTFAALIRVRDFPQGLCHPHAHQVVLQCRSHKLPPQHSPSPIVPLALFQLGFLFSASFYISAEEGATQRTLPELSLLSLCSGSCLFATPLSSGWAVKHKQFHCLSSANKLKMKLISSLLDGR